MILLLLRELLSELLRRFTLKVHKPLRLLTNRPNKQVTMLLIVRKLLLLSLLSRLLVLRMRLLPSRIPLLLLQSLLLPAWQEALLLIRLET